MGHCGRRLVGEAQKLRDAIVAVRRYLVTIDQRGQRIRQRGIGKDRNVRCDRGVYDARGPHTTAAGHDGNAVWQGLLDRSILIRNCASWPRLDDCLHITLGTPEENGRFLEALADTIRTANPTTANPTTAKGVTA